MKPLRMVLLRYQWVPIKPMMFSVLLISWISFWLVRYCLCYICYLYCHRSLPQYAKNKNIIWYAHAGNLAQGSFTGTNCFLLHLSPEARKNVITRVIIFLLQSDSCDLQCCCFSCLGGTHTWSNVFQLLFWPFAIYWDKHVYFSSLPSICILPCDNMIKLKVGNMWHVIISEHFYLK